MPLGFSGGLSEISARYGQTLVRGLEQSGAILSHGLQQIQTNRQLREFGSALSTINPESPDFPQRAIGLAGNFPLAMQDQRGQAMLALDARAHANWTQSQQAMDMARTRQSMRTSEPTIGQAWAGAGTQPALPSGGMGDAGGGMTAEPGAGALFGGQGDTAPTPPQGFSDRAGMGRFSFGATGNEEAPKELAPLPDAPATPDKVQAFRGSLLRNAPGLPVKEGERKIAQYTQQVQRDEDAKAKMAERGQGKWKTIYDKGEIVGTQNDTTNEFRSATDMGIDIQHPKYAKTITHNGDLVGITKDGSAEVIRSGAPKPNLQAAKNAEADVADWNRKIAVKNAEIKGLKEFDWAKSPNKKLEHDEQLKVLKSMEEERAKAVAKRDQLSAAAGSPLTDALAQPSASDWRRLVPQ